MFFILLRQKEKMKRIFVLIVAAAAFVCSGAEYFVSNFGNDSWQGSAAKPFKTILKAASKVKPGDTVTVRGGVYHELLTLRTSGTPEKPIIFRGVPGETVLMTGAYPVEKKWKKTAGTRFVYESFSPYEVNMLFDSKLINRYMRVDSLDMLDRQPGAFMLDKKTGKLYVNTFTGAHPDSLRFMIVPFLAGGSRFGVNANAVRIPFSGNTKGVYSLGKGVMIYGSNIIWENFHMAFYPGQSIRVNAPAANVIIRNNTLFGGTCGIMFYGAVKNSKILNNKVFRVAGTGIQLAGDGSKCLIKGNYVYNCGTCSPFKGARNGSEGNVFNIAHYGGYQYSDIIDNTVVSDDQERCGRTLMRNKGAIRKFTTQTGNVFYGGGVSLYATDDGSALLANNTVFGGGISIGSLTSGGKYTPEIRDNLFLTQRQDPKFADVFHRDFRLRPDSPFLGKGAFPKAGDMLYVKPAGNGDGSTPEKAAGFTAALARVKGGTRVIYMLPGEYTGKAMISGNIKLANFKGGKVTVKNGVLIGKGKISADGIIFKGGSFRIKGKVTAIRSVFDGCDLQSDDIVLKNTTLRESRIAGRTTLRDSLLLGMGNKLTLSRIISENNCFTSQEALTAFQKQVREAHRSFCRSVTLDKEFTLPQGSDLACAGIDCSAVGGRAPAPAVQALTIEKLQAKAVSSSSVMVTWQTPRHYCDVSVRCYSISEKKESSVAHFRQGGLRETAGEVLLDNFKPGKSYRINLYFYPINGQARVSRQINFKMPEGFSHKPVTLQVDKKAPGAFRSISAAMAKAGPGDTIMVGPGTYTEAVAVYLSGITLKSRIPGKAVLNLGGLLNYCIKTQKTTDVTIDGFRFTGLPYSASSTTVRASAVKNFTMRNCYFTRPAHGGTGNIHLMGFGPEGMLIENCVFDSGFHGIWIYPGKNVTVRNCTFSGGGVNAIHVGCEQGDRTEIYNNIFVDTVSNHNSPAVSVAEHGKHVYCDYNLYWKTKRAPMQRYYSFGRYKPNHTYSAVWHVKKKDMPLTLADTRKRFGVEKHAIEADPLFADERSGNFALKKNSPAIGKGRDGKNIGADMSVFK